MFLDNYSDELQNYREKIRKQNNSNIFSAISDVYKRENYTSDILRFILDPKALGLGDRYLSKFLELIEIDKESFITENDNLEVLREEHRIDILIKNTTQKKAIIIESKLNNAPDQPIQLVRYYANLKKDNYDVLKVVYLSVEPKTPDLKYVKNYGIKNKDFDDVKNEIEKVLCKICIASNDKTGEYKSLTQLFENENVSETDIITQFKNLLKSIEGETMEEAKKIIEDIFNCKSKIDNANNFEDIWKSRGKILKDIFIGNFETFNELGEWQLKNDCYYLQNTKVYLCPMHNSKESFWVQIGFYSDSENLPQKKEQYRRKLKEMIERQGLDFDNSINVYEKYWHCYEYVYDEQITIECYITNVKNMVKYLLQNS